MDLNKKKITRLSMRNNAYKIIKEAIITGELEPGRKIKDAELSDQLGISRTPVREAMLRLEDEEFIISKPNSYTMVAPINITEVKEIYSIIIALEILALQDAISTTNTNQIKKLEIINKKYSEAIKAGNAKKCLKYDIEFHHSLVDLSSNKELKKILKKLKDKVRRIESFYFHKSSPKQKSLNEHNIIIEGIKNKNLLEASNMLRENWMNSLNSILSEHE